MNCAICDLDLNLEEWESAVCARCGQVYTDGHIELDPEQFEFLRARSAILRMKANRP